MKRYPSWLWFLAWLVVAGDVALGQTAPTPPNGTTAAALDMTVNTTNNATNGTTNEAVTTVASNNATLNEPDCYNDIDTLRAALDAKNPFVPHVYILCPHTIFTFGVNNASNYCCIHGPAGLSPRKDATIQCGASGSSSNNCTFRNGTAPLQSFKYNYNEEVKSNAVLRGITFESADEIGILIVTDGDFLFDDCIIQNHTNLGAVHLFHVYSNRHLTESSEVPVTTDRQLQEAEQEPPPNGVRQRVTFHNCLFRHNGPSNLVSDNKFYGVIKAGTPYVEIIVNNSIFMDNAFEGAAVVGDSFALSVSEGSTLEIYNSCFVRNNFIGRGVVVVDTATELLALGGNYGSVVDGNVTCQFIYVDATASCVEFDSRTCLAERYASLVDRGYISEAPMGNTNATDTSRAVRRHGLDATTLLPLTLWLWQWTRFV